MTTTAQDRARLIREGLAAVWDLLTAAYDAEDWKTLGYSSWEAYCTGEFSGRIPRLAKSERGGVVQDLAGHGMPIKAIAAATGVARNTVRKDLRTAEEQPEEGQNDPSEEPQISRDEWAATVHAELARSFNIVNKSLAGIRRDLPGLRVARDRYAIADAADLIALVEHEDGTPVTDEEHRAALLNEGANYSGGDIDTARYVAYLRDNRPNA
ncbi:hypothetical protein ABZ546_01460 [Brachybacterium paraconglomeratum]